MATSAESIEELYRNRYASFVWALLGSAAGLDSVSLGPLLLVPTALVAVFVWRRPQARRSAFGLLTGAGTLLLYVAWVQRDGPGTTCWHTATASGCDQHLNPLPWLVLGLVLVAAGFVAHARQTQANSPGASVPE